MIGTVKKSFEIVFTNTKRELDEHHLQTAICERGQRKEHVKK